MIQRGVVSGCPSGGVRFVCFHRPGGELGKRHVIQVHSDDDPAAHRPEGTTTFPNSPPSTPLPSPRSLRNEPVVSVAFPLPALHAYAAHAGHAGLNSPWQT